MEYFRLVVRGNDTNGQRIRRVRSIEAANLIEAWGAFYEVRDDMAHGLVDTGFSVLPEVGVRLDGALSKGYEAA